MEPQGLGNRLEWAVHGPSNSFPEEAWTTREVRYHGADAISGRGVSEDGSEIAGRLYVHWPL